MDYVALSIAVFAVCLHFVAIPRTQKQILVFLYIKRKTSALICIAEARTTCPPQTARMELFDQTGFWKRSASG
jgi:hypothetical protein